jgi:hypothetical protein
MIPWYLTVIQPATLNAAEWKALSELAKKKKLFLMEGKFFHPYKSSSGQVAMERR